MMMPKAKLFLGGFIFLLVSTIGCNAYGFDDVATARSEGKRIIFLWGDSISCGAIYQELIEKYPTLEDFARPDKLANIIAQENNLSVYFKALNTSLYDLSQMIEKGKEIKDGDIIIFQDAGPHANDLELYRSHLIDIRYHVLSKNPKLKLIFTTTYDENPDLKNSSWSIPIKHGKTMNQLIVKTAKERLRSGMATVKVIDIDQMFRKAKKYLKGYGVELVFEDRIHFTLIGNIVFVDALFDGLDYKIKKTNLHEKIIALNVKGLPSLIRRPAKEVKLDEMKEIVQKVLIERGKG